MTVNGECKLFKIPQQPEEGFKDRGYAENFLKSLIQKADSFPFNIESSKFTISKVYVSKPKPKMKVVN